MGTICCSSTPSDESQATEITKPTPEGSDDPASHTHTSAAVSANGSHDQNGGHSVPSQSNFSHLSDRERSPSKETRQRLLEFYAVHNPEKQSSSTIDEILSKYKGNEDRLFADLHRKYGLSTDGGTTVTPAVDADGKGTESKEESAGKDVADTPSPSAADEDMKTGNETETETEPKTESKPQSVLRGIAPIKMERPSKFKAATMGTALFGTSTPKQTPRATSSKHNASSSMSSSLRSASFILETAEVNSPSLSRPVCPFLAHSEQRRLTVNR